MRLLSRCHHCQEDIKVKSLAHNRYELADSKGDFFEIQCPNCHEESRCHVNEVSATKSNYTIVLTLAVFVFGTIGVFFYIKDYIDMIYNAKAAFVLAWITAIPSMVYVILNRQEKRKINDFNRHKVVI